MSTPTTTEKTRRVSNQQMEAVYNAAWEQIRPAEGDDLDALVPWELANLYMQAAKFRNVFGVGADYCTGPHGEALGHITGQL